MISNYMCIFPTDALIRFSPNTFHTGKKESLEAKTAQRCQTCMRLLFKTFYQQIKNCTSLIGLSAIAGKMINMSNVLTLQ